MRLFCSFLALLTLAGCGGGPSNRTAVTGVCKSCKPYFVRGSWHHPQTHYEYDEVGLASWYGPGFHGKPKPYGELFDQNVMTAAHKTLPLPTIVRVTDLGSGKSIKVLVDDRGPFVYDGRIIDLSMGAAKALGTYQKGVAKVRVQALVAESKAFADYLARHGNKNGRDKNGRTWLEVFREEVEGKHGSEESDSTTSIVTEQLPTKPEAIAKSSAPLKMPKAKASINDLVQELESLGVANDKVVTNASVAKASATKPVVGTVGKTYIDVGGGFVQKANAEKILVELGQKFSGQVVQTTHSSGQKFYVTRLGPFADEKSASKVLNQLAGMGQSDAIIIKK